MQSHSFLNPSFGDLRYVAKKVSKAIVYHQNTMEDLAQNAIIYKLKSNKVEKHKHKILMQNYLTPASLKIFDIGEINKFNGISNNSLIKERVLALSRQAKQNNCYITYNDICFLLSITREVFRKYRHLLLKVGINITDSEAE